MFSKKYYVGFDDEEREFPQCASTNVEDIVEEMNGSGFIYEYDEEQTEILNQGHGLTLEISLINPKKLTHDLYE